MAHKRGEGALRVRTEGQNSVRTVTDREQKGVEGTSNSVGAGSENGVRKERETQGFSWPISLPNPNLGREAGESQPAFRTECSEQIDQELNEVTEEQVGRGLESPGGKRAYSSGDGFPKPKNPTFEVGPN